jgi:hypothetical protein
LSSLPASPDEHRNLITLLIVSAFIVVGGMHYQTPMLAQIAAEFEADAAATGWIPTCSFDGMMLGILFLVPLGYRFDKRKLVLCAPDAGATEKGSSRVTPHAIPWSHESSATVMSEWPETLSPARLGGGN